MTDDPLLRPTEVAKELEVSQETVWRWLRQGVIAYEEIGPFRKKRIRRSVVEEQRRSVPRSCDNTSHV